MDENPILEDREVPTPAAASSNAEGPTPPAPPAPPSPPAAPPPALAAEAPFLSLDPKVVRVQRVVGWIVLGTIASINLVVLIPILLFTPILDWVKVLMALAWIALAGGFGLLVHRWPPLAYRHASYRLDDVGIEIRRGVYWRRAIRIPRSRVQHLDVTQGPVERGLGLGTLVIYTAGTDHAQVQLEGLAHATALELRDGLLPEHRPGEADDAV